MRICASISGVSDLDKVGDADMVEIRLDLLGHVPKVKDKDLLVTYRTPFDPSVLPRGYRGLIDIGEEERPDTELGVVASHHDYERTPNAERIRSILDDQDSDICKAAFMVNGFRDLVSISDAARKYPKKHVVLGMGSLGTVTRIRQKLIGNEFTFGYVGEPTAPGQLSVSEMRRLGDDCIIIGIVGDPLSKSKSSVMQNAALRASSINGIYLPFETKSLDCIEEAIRAYDIRGMNVTIPYKQDIMDHLDAVDAAASSIGAVNTIVNDDGRLVGYNTDVKGISKALSVANIVPKGMRALIMGSGGAAKACAYELSSHGCDITVTGRNRVTGEEIAKEFGMTYRQGDSVSVRMYDLIVNCTPVGMYSDGPYPINISAIDRSQSVFDMVYGCRTPLVKQAEEKGCRVAYGADMLAGQGSASFALWTGVENTFDIMRRELK